MTLLVLQEELAQRGFYDSPTNRALMAAITDLEADFDIDLYKDLGPQRVEEIITNPYLQYSNALNVFSRLTFGDNPPPYIKKFTDESNPDNVTMTIAEWRQSQTDKSMPLPDLLIPQGVQVNPAQIAKLLQIKREGVVSPEILWQNNLLHTLVYSALYKSKFNDIRDIVREIGDSNWIAGLREKSIKHLHHIVDALNLLEDPAELSSQDPGFSI